MALRAIDIGPGLYQNLAEMDRSLIDSVANSQAGVILSGSGTTPGTVTDFLVTPVVGSHQVQVAPGRAVVRETSNPFIRGSYFVTEDAAESFSLPVPDTNPFIATVVLRVTDPQYGSVTGTVGPRVDVIKGTPASSPVAVSDAAISAVSGTPGGWLRLADVRVNTGDSGAIPGGQFTDRRSPGGFGRINALSNMRPVAPSNNLEIVEMDTRANGTWDATISKWLMHDTKKQSHAVTWGSSTGVAFGSGSVHTMYYLRRGEMCEIFHRWYTGTTGFSGGAGNYFFSLPFGMSSANMSWFGAAKFNFHGVEVQGLACIISGENQLVYLAPYQLGGLTNAPEMARVRNSGDGSVNQGFPRWAGDYTWKQENPGFIEGQLTYAITIP